MKAIKNILALPSMENEADRQTAQVLQVILNCLWHYQPGVSHFEHHCEFPKLGALRLTGQYFAALYVLGVGIPAQGIYPPGGRP